MERSVPKRRHIKFRRRGITLKKKTFRTRRKFEIENISCCYPASNPGFFSPLPNSPIPPPPTDSPHSFFWNLILFTPSLFLHPIPYVKEGLLIFLLLFHKNLCSAAVSFLSIFFVISVKIPLQFFKNKVTVYSVGSTLDVTNSLFLCYTIHWSGPCDLFYFWNYWFRLWAGPPTVGDQPIARYLSYLRRSTDQRKTKSRVRTHDARFPSIRGHTDLQHWDLSPWQRGLQVVVS